MAFARRIQTELAAFLNGDALRDFRRNIAEARRVLRRRAHQVHYFHEIPDPYSHLAAQILPELSRRYDIEIVPHLVGEPQEVPEPQMLSAYARKDAADVAGPYGLVFPRDAPTPEVDLVRKAARILAASSAEVFVERAAEVGVAVWAGDRGGLETLGQEMSFADDDRVRGAIAEGSARRKRLGHYSGGMFFYGSEWFWGVDRLEYLERRLREFGLARDGIEDAPIVGRPESDFVPRGAPEKRPVLEYFPSLRSPYTYISMERVFDLCRRFGIELVLRPVLPMVMRGMTVPMSKRMYISLDTKREADTEGIPYGRVCDPVGEPVERGFALYPHARSKGRAAEYLLSFARGVFADGIDAGTELGLRVIAERAGLIWDEAQENREDESWREEFEMNRQAMFAAGLWGVPSFRILSGAGHPEFATWGQDRIWLVEQELERRLEGLGTI